MRYSVYLILFIMCSSVYGQKIYGTIRDLETDEPLPFVHIKLQHYYFGTVSNSDGQFSINLPGVEHQVLEFSAIGYETTELKVADLHTSENLIIRLKRNDIKLSEVIITPKDHAFKLMKAAIEHIPQNYPSEPEVLKAFLRNTVLGPSGNPFYVIELTELLAKSSYEKRSNTGFVEILQSQKIEFQAIDSLGVKFYNGAHSGFWGDLVATRELIFDIDLLADYDLELVDTTFFHNKPLYQVSFMPSLESKAVGQGSVYVQDGTYAITSFSLWLDRNDLSRRGMPLKEMIHNLRRMKNEYQVSYEENDSVWRLKDVHYHSYFEKDNAEYMRISDELIIIAKDSSKFIPFDRSLSPTAIVLDEVNDYDVEYWSNETVLLAAGTLRSKLENSPVRNPMDKAEKERLLEFLSKIESELSVAVIRVHTSGSEIAYGPLSISQQTSEDPVVAANVLYGYKINNRWGAGIETSGSLGSLELTNFGIFGAYHFSLKKYGRSAMLIPKLGLGKMSISRQMGTISSADYSSQAKQKLDAPRSDAYLMQRLVVLKPELEYKIHLKRRMNMIVSAAYYCSLFTKAGIYIEEIQPFYKRKSYFELLESQNSQEIYRPEFELRVGISL